MKVEIKRLREENSSLSIGSLTTNDTMISLYFPSYKVFTNGKSVKHKFLGYFKSEQAKESFLNTMQKVAMLNKTLDLCPEWIGYSQLISNKVMLIDISDQKLSFTCSFPFVSWAKQALLPSNIEMEPSAKLLGNSEVNFSFDITERTEIRSLERRIDNYFLTFKLLDARIISYISSELTKKKIKILQHHNNEIVFSKPCLSFKRFRNCKVHVKAENGIVGIKILLVSNEKDKQKFTQDGFSRLQKYFYNINGSIEFGYFSCNPKTMDIWYSINYHEFRTFESCKNVPLEKQGLNQGFLFFIQKYFDICSLHLTNIYEALVLETSLEEIIRKGKKLKSFKTQAESVNVKILTDEEALLELKIINILSSQEDYFFSSRFRNHLIENRGNEFMYTSPSEGETFAQISNQQSFEATCSIIELAEELALQNLYFKNNRFSLEDFLWVLQRPTYKYNQPLHKILEYRENENLESYMNCFKNELDVSFVNFHRQKIANMHNLKDLSVVREDHEDVKYFIEDPHTANIRYALFLENNYPFMVRYHGVSKINGQTVILYTEIFKEPAIEEISKGGPEYIMVNLHEILNMISDIQSKNSEICAFDETSIGFYYGKLKWLIFTNQQVSKNFKAPEVLQGRTHRAGLIYSFGKYVMEIFKKWIQTNMEDTVADDDFWLGRILEAYPESELFFTRLLEKNKMKRSSLEEARQLLNQLKRAVEKFKSV